jgi:hypothetical protein
MPKSKKLSDGAEQPSVAHPYTRIHAMNQDGKLRKPWTHALENLIFSESELYDPF